MCMVLARGAERFYPRSEDVALLHNGSAWLTVMCGVAGELVLAQCFTRRLLQILRP